MARVIPAIISVAIGIEENAATPISTGIRTIVSVVPNGRWPKADTEETAGAVSIVGAAGHGDESRRSSGQSELVH